MNLKERLPFKDVQYVYTNKCHMSNITNYCSVPKNIKPKTEIRWIKRACDLFKKYDLQVKVLGGNPSDEDDFCEFITYMNDIGLDYVITDNATNIQKLLNRDVKGVMFSLDTLGRNNIGGCSSAKSVNAIRAIEHYYDNFDYIGANIVINSKNIYEIPLIIEFLTEHNVIANLCPLISGHNDKINYLFRVSESQYSLDKLKNCRDKIKGLVNILIEMKSSDYKIGCPVEYLEDLPQVIKCGCDWFNWGCKHITDIPILRVNTNLSLMVCSDISGSMERHTVFDIESKFDEINKTWVSDNNRIHCAENNGCYWSNIVIADIYRNQGMGTLEATRRNL